MAPLEGALATAHLTIVRHGERVDETADAAAWTEAVCHLHPPNAAD